MRAPEIGEPSAVTITAGEAVFFDGGAEDGREPYSYKWDFDELRSGVSDKFTARPGFVTFDD